MNHSQKNHFSQISKKNFIISSKKSIGVSPNEGRLGPIHQKSFSHRSGGFSGIIPFENRNW
jgi:hypothetical protein